MDIGVISRGLYAHANSSIWELSNISCSSLCALWAKSRRISKISNVRGDKDCDGEDELDDGGDERHERVGDGIEMEWKWDSIDCEVVFECVKLK